MLSALHNYSRFLKYVNSTSRYRAASRWMLHRLVEGYTERDWDEEKERSSLHNVTRRPPSLNPKRYLIFSSAIMNQSDTRDRSLFALRLSLVILYSMRCQIYGVIRTLIRRDYVVPRRYYEFLSAFLREIPFVPLFRTAKSPREYRTAPRGFVCLRRIDESDLRCTIPCSVIWSMDISRFIDRSPRCLFFSYLSRIL